MIASEGVLDRPKVFKVNCSEYDEYVYDTTDTVQPKVPRSAKENDCVVFELLGGDLHPWKCTKSKVVELPLKWFFEGDENAPYNLELPETVLHDDAMEFYRNVFTAKSTRYVYFDVKLRPCDPTVALLGLGEPCADWHYVRCSFPGYLFKKKNRWSVNVCAFENQPERVCLTRWLTDYTLIDGKFNSICVADFAAVAEQIKSN